MDIKRISIIYLSLLLTGCNSLQAPQPVADDKAAIQLTEAASAISHSLNDLAAIQQATTPAPILKRLPDASDFAIPGSASIDWSGPIEPLLQRIATISHYQLRILGARPSIPVLVTINANDLPLATIVRDIAFQATNQANVVVYPGSQVLELRYLRF